MVKHKCGPVEVASIGLIGKEIENISPVDSGCDFHLEKKQQRLVFQWENPDLSIHTTIEPTIGDHFWPVCQTLLQLQGRKHNKSQPKHFEIPEWETHAGFRKHFPHNCRPAFLGKFFCIANLFCARVDHEKQWITSMIVISTFTPLVQR